MFSEKKRSLDTLSGQNQNLLTQLSVHNMRIEVSMVATMLRQKEELLTQLKSYNNTLD